MVNRFRFYYIDCSFVCINIFQVKKSFKFCVKGITQILFFCMISVQSVTNDQC